MRVSDADGTRILRTGPMAVVITGGRVQVGDQILTAPPPGSAIPLQRV